MLTRDEKYARFQRVREARPQTLAQARELLEKAEVWEDVRELRYVIHPSILTKLHGRPYRTIFADATSYRHAQEALEAAGWDLSLHTLYGHDDFAASAFLSDARLESIMESVRRFCRSALPFTAHAFHRWRHHEVGSFDVGVLDEAGVDAVRDLTDPQKRNDVPAKDVGALREAGAVLGVDWSLHRERARFVRGLVGIRMEERGGNLEAVDRLASILLAVDKSRYVSTLVSGSGMLLPYTLLMEVEAPEYHALDEFTDLLIDKDMETRTIFIAKTLRDGAPRAQRDAPRAGSLPPHLGERYARLMVELPVEAVREFDRASPERQYKVLNRLQHLDRLPVVPSTLGPLADYKHALARGDVEAQVRAFSSLAVHIESRVADFLRGFFRARWKDEWPDRVRQELNVRGLDEATQSMKALATILSKLRERRWLPVGKEEGEIPAREFDFVVDTLDELRPLRNRSAHVAADKFKEKVIVDPASFEVAVYDAILKAVICTGVLEQRFGARTPGKVDGSTAEELAALRRALDASKGLTPERIREDVQRAAPLLRWHGQAFPEVVTTRDLRKALAQTLQRYEEALPPGRGADGIAQALHAAARALESPREGRVAAEPFVVLVEEAAKGGEGLRIEAVGAARRIARELAKLFLLAQVEGVTGAASRSSRTSPA